MPFHSMIYLGESQIEKSAARYLVYHTGPGPNEIRRPTVDELLHFPEPDWRPLAGQSPLPRRLPLEHFEKDIMKLLRLLLLALLAAPGLSQSEDEPYFALSTQRTFARQRQAIGLAQRVECGCAGISRLPHQRSRPILHSNWRARTNSAGAPRAAARADVAGAHPRVETRPAHGNPARAARASSPNRRARTWKASCRDRPSPQPAGGREERSTQSRRC